MLTKLSPLGILLGGFVLSAHGQTLEMRNRSGVRIAVDAEDRNPALSLVAPRGPESERTSIILFPEHVTVRVHGQSEPKHVYMFRPGKQGDAPHWAKVGNALEYAS